MNNIANVHRFGDKVAVYVGDGSTTYLTAKQARALARALRDCAKSVVDEEFANSAFGSRDIPKVSPYEADLEARKWPRNKGALK